MNLPNRLTVLRICLVPFMVAALLCDFLPHRFLIAGLVFGAASLTDLFDGKIARKRNLITSFGKFADPLADKILVISALCCFVDLRLISSVAVILVLFREFAVTSIRLAASQNGEVISANIWGKAKTVSQMIAVIVVFVTQYFIELCEMGIIPLLIDENMLKGVYIINNVCICISVALTLISGIIYIKDNFKYINNM